MNRARGVALVTGLLLWSLLSLLAMAAATAARIELQLARNERFRENAVSAASAGIEMAIAQIPNYSPESVPARVALRLAEAQLDVQTRFLGLELGLPQVAGQHLAGAHFEINSLGRSGRGAVDRQRSYVMFVVSVADAPEPGCDPAPAGVRCFARGELLRLSWQRLPEP